MQNIVKNERKIIGHNWNCAIKCNCLITLMMPFLMQQLHAFCTLYNTAIRKSNWSSMIQFLFLLSFLTVNGWNRESALFSSLIFIFLI